MPSLKSTTSNIKSSNLNDVITENTKNLSSKESEKLLNEIKQSLDNTNINDNKSLNQLHTSLSDISNYINSNTKITENEHTILKNIVQQQSNIIKNETSLTTRISKSLSDKTNAIADRGFDFDASTIGVMMQSPMIAWVLGKMQKGVESGINKVRNIKQEKQRQKEEFESRRNRFNNKQETEPTVEVDANKNKITDLAKTYYTYKMHGMVKSMTNTNTQRKPVNPNPLVGPTYSDNSSPTSIESIMENKRSAIRIYKVLKHIDKDLHKILKCVCKKSKKKKIVNPDGGWGIDPFKLFWAWKTYKWLRDLFKKPAAEKVKKKPDAEKVKKKPDAEKTPKKPDAETTQKKITADKIPLSKVKKIPNVKFSPKSKNLLERLILSLEKLSKVWFNPPAKNLLPHIKVQPPKLLEKLPLNNFDGLATRLFGKDLNDLRLKINNAEKATADNTKTTADNTKTTADNTKTTADNTKTSTENTQQKGTTTDATGKPSAVKTQHISDILKMRNQPNQGKTGAQVAEDNWAKTKMSGSDMFISRFLQFLNLPVDLQQLLTDIERKQWIAAAAEATGIQLGFFGKTPLKQGTGIATDLAARYFRNPVPDESGKYSMGLDDDKLKREFKTAFWAYADWWWADVGKFELGEYDKEGNRILFSGRGASDVFDWIRMTVTDPVFDAIGGLFDFSYWDSLKKALTGELHLGDPAANTNYKSVAKTTDAYLATSDVGGLYKMFPSLQIDPDQSQYSTPFDNTGIERAWNDRISNRTYNRGDNPQWRSGTKYEWSDFNPLDWFISDAAAGSDIPGSALFRQSETDQVSIALAENKHLYETIKDDRDILRQSIDQGSTSQLKTSDKMDQLLALYEKKETDVNIEVEEQNRITEAENLKINQEGQSNIHELYNNLLTNTETTFENIGVSLEDTVEYISSSLENTFANIGSSLSNMFDNINLISSANAADTSNNYVGHGDAGSQIPADEKARYDLINQDDDDFPRDYSQWTDDMDYYYKQSVNNLGPTGLEQSRESGRNTKTLTKAIDTLSPYIRHMLPDNLPVSGNSTTGSARVPVKPEYEARPETESEGRSRRFTANLVRSLGMTSLANKLDSKPLQKDFEQPGLDNNRVNQNPMARGNQFQNQQLTMAQKINMLSDEDRDTFEFGDRNYSLWTNKMQEDVDTAEFGERDHSSWTNKMQDNYLFHNSQADPDNNDYSPNPWMELLPNHPKWNEQYKGSETDWRDNFNSTNNDEYYDSQMGGSTTAARTYAEILRNLQIPQYIQSLIPGSGGGFNSAPGYSRTSSSNEDDEGLGGAYESFNKRAMDGWYQEAKDERMRSGRQRRIEDDRNAKIFTTPTPHLDAMMAKMAAHDKEFGWGDMGYDRTAIEGYNQPANNRQINNTNVTNNYSSSSNTSFSSSNYNNN